MAQPAYWASRIPRILWILVLSSGAAAASGDPRGTEALPLGEATSVVQADGLSSPSPAYLPNLMEVVQVGGSLAGVIILLVGVRAVLRRYTGLSSTRRPDGVIQIHARYPVARGQQIMLLQVGDRIIVAHHGGGRLETLAEISDPTEVAKLRGRLQGESASDREFAHELSRIQSEGDIVDLTRPAQPPNSARRRSRLPGWRSGS